MAFNDLAQDFWFHHSHWKLSLSPPPLSCMNFSVGSMCMEQSILFSSPSQTAASPHAHGDFSLLFSLYRPKEHKKVGMDLFPRSLQANREEEKRSREGLSGTLPIPIPIVHQDNQRVDSSAVIPSHPYYLHQNAKFQSDG